MNRHGAALIFPAGQIFCPANFSSQSSGFRFANQVCIRNSPKAAA